MLSGADKLAAHTEAPGAFVGFDGFLDVILHVVDERQDAHTFRRMDSMAQYAERVQQAVGYSANIELVPVTMKLGGNGPIMADALHHMGCRITYAGALGVPDIHPVFADFAQACDHVISLSDPATTDALEFVDGKLLVGKLQNLLNINWSNLCRHLPEQAMLDLLAEVKLVAAVNWTMLPAMNELLIGLQAMLQRTGNRPIFFVDLADPRKRTREDIQQVLELLTYLQSQADVVLGMNEHESAQVEKIVLGEADMDLRNRAIRLRESLNLHLVVIHPLRSACVADAQGVVQFDGPFTPQPRLTTGAGDTFNAGFCRGLLAGLTPQEAIGCGVCASGFYVREARPPTLPELVAFMRSWAAAECCSEYNV